MQRLRSALLRISQEEASFHRRGFRVGDPDARERLEHIGRTFLQGYHAVLDDRGGEAFVARLNAVDLDVRGFAYEGAATALSLLDALTPWHRTRWLTFVKGPAAAHVYMVHVGVGWALARIPWWRRRIERPLARLDPLLRWLAVDGYGFHEGFFGGPRFMERQGRAPLRGYACRAFDQGLGRSLWFVEGADVSRIPIAIATFDPSRHADLWSGVGLACTYAGDVNDDALTALRLAAGRYQSGLAQGAAFASTARLRAANPAEHTTRACEIFCGLSVAAAAQVVDDALDNLPENGPEPAYEIWRRRIQGRLAQRVTDREASRAM